MYRIDNESIERKILDSRFSTDEEANKTIKESLLKLVKELCDYTTQVNQKLVNKVLDKDNSTYINDITVALIPNEDDKVFECIGLFKMAEENTKRIFIDDEYENIRLINGDLSAKKKYRGKYIKNGTIVYFDYELRFDRTFLELQELLYKYSEQYKIHNPIIFSPYSHKSFYVIYDSEINKENIELDFCFDENGIKAIENSNLFWNIKKDVVRNKTYDAKIPYGDKTRFLYSFSKTKKGKYVFPYPFNEQTIIYDIEIGDMGVNIVTNKEIDDFVIIEYFDVDSSSSNVKAAISSKVLFNNKKKYTGTIHRIISEGDVEHAITPFREWNGLNCIITREKNHKVMRYSARYRVDRKDKFMFSPISTKYIEFSKKDDKFLDDYANYVIEFLEYYYPEIEWVGEK